MIQKFFGFLGSLIERHPFRSVFVLLGVFGIFIVAGIPQVEMATGNDTLVQPDNEVYQSNLAMEEEFGSDPIIILFEDESAEGNNLYDYDNLKKISQIEDDLKNEETIHTIISPASLIDQIAGQMSSEMGRQLPDIVEGLEMMSDRMGSFSQGMEGSELPDMEALKNDLIQMSEMLELLDRLENNLSLGNLQTEIAKLNNMNAQLLEQMSEISGQDLPDFQLLQSEMTNLMNVLGPLSAAMNEETTDMTAIQAELDNLEAFDFSQLSSMLESLKQASANLNNMSEGISTMHSRSDMLQAGFPETEETLNAMIYEDEAQTELRGLFDSVMVDDNHYRMVISLKGESQREKGETEQLINTVDELIEEAEFETITPVISGKPVLDDALQSEMRANMIRMVILIIIVMVVILSSVFNVRWRLMSLVTIFLAVVATIGLMSMLGVPITMVSMAVFPILIGLGINYSIQFQNRYEEERSVRPTIANVGLAVTISVVATMLGFISLYISPVPMIQDFGSMLTIGVLLALLAGMFFLAPSLQILDANKSRVKDEHTDNKRKWDVDRLIGPLTKGVVGLRWPVLITSMILAVAGFAVDGKVGVETNIENFMPQDMPALNDIRYIRDIVGSTDQVSIHLEDDDTILTDENMEWISEIASDLEEKYPEKINSIQSVDSIIETVNESGMSEGDETYQATIEALPVSQTKLVINEDHSESVIILGVESLPSEEMDAFINELNEEIEDAPMKASIAGASALDVELVEGLTKGRVQMTLLGLALVFLVLAVIYRSVLKPLTVVLPVLFIVGMSSGIMYLLSINFTPITSTLGALILGMGTEMNIMVLERYLEERKQYEDKFQAIQVAAAKIGKANLASALTTIGGFSVLILSTFVILKDFGIMTVINVTLAALSTFIVMPAVLIIMDKRLVKP